MKQFFLLFVFFFIWQIKDYSLIHSFILLSVHPFIHPSIHLFIYLFNNDFPEPLLDGVDKNFDFLHAHPIYNNNSENRTFLALCSQSYKNTLPAKLPFKPVLLIHNCLQSQTDSARVPSFTKINTKNVNEN